MDNEEGREQLHDAIRKYMEENDEDNSLLSNWVLVAAESRVNDDGRTSTFLTVVTDRYQPVHITAGLLKYAVVRNEDHMIGGFES